MTQVITYLGVPVLTTLPHRIEQDEPIDRNVALTASPAGRFSARSGSALPAMGRPFPWFLASRADITAAEAFLTQQTGRYAGVWVPTYVEGMQYVSIGTDPATGWQGPTVRATDYSALLFPEEFRRHLVAIEPSGTIHGPWRVYRVLDNTDGTTTLIAQGSVYPFVGSSLAPADPATVLWCFLAYCRLADDEIQRRYYAPDLADQVLTFTELPHEVPL